MEDQCDSATISDRSCSFERSDSRVTGEKRGSLELGDKHEFTSKRVKMRDLESVLRSEGFSTHHPNDMKNEKDYEMYQLSKEGTSLITAERVSMSFSGSKAERTERKHNGSLDLNTEAIIANKSFSNNSRDGAETCGKPSMVRKPDRERSKNCIASRGVGLDLNADDASSSINQDPFYPLKNHSHIRSRDISECGSTTGPLEDNDPLKRWKEMKQNGFLSSSYGGIPAPKPRGRKTKADALKKKMEIAKREQVDRFTKIAAPSGLLNELNPGIINHVRNRKQVHSIIESLVRSEKLENEQCDSKHANHLKSQSDEISNMKDPENMNVSVANRFGFPCENVCLNTSLESEQMRLYPMVVDKYIQEEKSGDISSLLERVCGKSCATDSPLSEDDTLALKLTSSTNASENANCFSNEESGNLTSVSSLSVKAATVASQWLELLHQDVKGRLAALRRSKKRVRAVINTELPFLISKEFSSDQENDPYVMQNSTEGFSTNATAEMHRARWTALFDQMDHSLSEEEKQLENWLNQVKEMQLHCDHGLQHFQWNPTHGLQQLGTLENDSRLAIADSSEKELAVQAAAASIYSTCSFLLSKENVPCF